MYLHTWILDIITFSFVSNIPIRCSTLSARTSVCNKKRRKCEKNKTICWRRLLPMFFISFAINTDDDQFKMLIQMVFIAMRLRRWTAKYGKMYCFIVDRFRSKHHPYCATYRVPMTWCLHFTKCTLKFYRLRFFLHHITWMFPFSVTTTTATITTTTRV